MFLSSLLRGLAAGHKKRIWLLGRKIAILYG
jgi:hypothetical protein